MVTPDKMCSSCKIWPEDSNSDDGLCCVCSGMAKADTVTFESERDEERAMQIAAASVSPADAAFRYNKLTGVDDTMCFFGEGLLYDKHSDMMEDLNI